MTTKLILETPPDFNFKTAVYSHGWCQLLPFELNLENWRLSYVFTGEKPLAATITENGGNLEIEIFEDVISRETKEKILREVRHILRLDESFGEFYRLTKKEKRLNWIAALDGATVPLVNRVPPLAISILLFPVIAWLVSRIDRWRLAL